MAKKSSKTAHVLNLLSSSSSAEPAPKEKDIPASAVNESFSKAAKSNEISSRIKDSLETELEKALANGAESPSPAKEPEESPKPFEGASFDSIDFEEIAPENLGEAEAAASDAPLETVPEQAGLSDAETEQPSPAETAPVQEAPSEAEAEALEIPGSEADLAQEETVQADEFPENPFEIESAGNDDFYYVNIGELLVEELAPEYMEKFGVCRCSRCTADVMAMALSKLPPKYIVTHDKEVPMLVDYYKEKMEVAVITEITKSCFSVMAKPRHKI